jgi:hypothetical protein
MKYFFPLWKSNFSALDKRELDQISFLYLLSVIKRNSLKSCRAREGKIKIFSHCSSQDYFRTRFFNQEGKSSFHRNKSGELVHPSWSYPDKLQDKLGHLIIWMKHHRLTIYNQDYHFPSEERMRISICYLLGFIETEFYPGINKKL